MNTKILLKLIDAISWPLWIYDFLRRHATIRSVLFWGTAAGTLIAVNFGVATLLDIGSMIARFAFAGMFMIFQFVVLFSFLSSTKTIEMYPGDVGAFSFEKDYFGQEYLVHAVRQWVESLTRDGKTKLENMGAEAIHGIMLEGPPGTGKTLLAQCLATDSKSAFFGCSGTDFQAMFIGVGPMKVMRMYSKARAAARQYGSAVVFIDEIDAIGGNRGNVSRNQPVAGGMAGGMFGGGGLGVLSKLLTELDGTKEVGRRDHIRNKMRVWFGLPELYQGLVLTIGATNRFDALDPALVRPGRIDKIIRVDPPDRGSRRKIIEGYLGKVQHDASVDVDILTDDTQGVSPAQLASSIQRSAPRHAINDGRNYISQSDIDAALQEDLVGLKNPIADFDPTQKRQVAYHEAGHALVSYLEMPERRITHVSIIRRGSGVLGYMRDVEAKEVYAMPVSYFVKRIKIAVAGHIATDVALGEPWTGADSDFNHVRFYMTQLALLGHFGGIPFDKNMPFESKTTKEKADEEQQRWLKETYTLVQSKRDLLDKLAAALLEKEELTSAETYAILHDEKEYVQ